VQFYFGGSFLVNLSDRYLAFRPPLRISLIDTSTMTFVVAFNSYLVAVSAALCI
jgi:hypothetical protein